MKLRGRFAVVKLKKSDKGNEWLLFKKKDEYSSKERKILEELPRSVFSGLTVEELERKNAIARGLEKEARAMGKPLGDAVIDSLAPIAPSPSAKPKGSGWTYDADLEGIRVLASRAGDRVTLSSFDASGSARSIEAFYPDVVRALRALPVTRLVADGEIVAFDPSGRPNGKLLAERAVRVARGPANVHRAVTTSPATLVVSDLLVLGDIDVRGAAIEKRRALLAKMLPPVGFLRAAPTLEGALDHVLASCAALELPGVVAKKKGSAYGEAWIHVASGVPRSRVTVDHQARDANAALRKVTVTNRTKIFWPEEPSAGEPSLTKGDLCDFYESMADAILPFLADRPVIVVRYPDGIDGKSFFQWNVPPGMPPWVRTMSFRGDDDDEPKRGFLVDDPSTLLYMANLACIPLHILACRVPELDQADFFTLDFDIKQSELRHAITLARTLKALLDEIGLSGFPKTSGQTGLHVLCPLGKGQNFSTACALADLLGKLLVERHPDIATMERVVRRRGPKVYVDTGQTGPTRAIVAPYSVRAVKGARVSTPLDWSELDAELDPARFTIKTVPARVATLGDPMKGLLEAQPDVAGAVAKLGELVR
jgi:bifunctional non-homologous end joining protein LigD